LVAAGGAIGIADHRDHLHGRIGPVVDASAQTVRSNLAPANQSQQSVLQLLL
jgi:hypothetical protein